MRNVIAIDTEYDQKTHVPYLASAAWKKDGQVQTKIFRLHVKKEFVILKFICESCLHTKIFHNAVSDIYALKQIDINVVPPYEDTLIMAALTQHQFSKVGLKILAKNLLGEEIVESKELKKEIGKLRKQQLTKEISWENVSADILHAYAEKDAYYTLLLSKFFRGKYDVNNYEFEKTLIQIIVNIQQNGLKIDREFVEGQIISLWKESKQIETALKKLIYMYHDKEVNLNSPLDLRAVFDKLGVKYSLTKNNLLSRSSESLLKYADENKNEVLSKLVDGIIKLRFYAKQLGTYFEPLLEYYTTDKDRYAHFSLYQTGARTGRFSAELIQTFPKKDVDQKTGLSREVRKAVICEDDELFVFFDFKQIEMRLFAHFSRSKKMLMLYSSNKDVYVEVAKDIFSEKVINVSAETFYICRYIAKQIALGLIYGMGVKKFIALMTKYLNDKLSDETKKVLSLSPDKLRMIIQKFYSIYQIRDFLQKTMTYAFNNGHVNLDTKIYGKPVKRKYIIEKDKSYKSVNVIIQGCAAIIMKSALVRTNTFIRKYSVPAKIRLTVHDEIGITIKKDFLRKHEYIIDDFMYVIEDHKSFSIPILSSCSFGSSWGNLREKTSNLCLNIEGGE